MMLGRGGRMSRCMCENNVCKYVCMRVIDVGGVTVVESPKATEVLQISLQRCIRICESTWPRAVERSRRQLHEIGF